MREQWRVTGETCSQPLFDLLFLDFTVADTVPTRDCFLFYAVVLPLSGRPFYSPQYTIPQRVSQIVRAPTQPKHMPSQGAKPGAGTLSGWQRTKYRLSRLPRRHGNIRRQRQITKGMWQTLPRTYCMFAISSRSNDTTLPFQSVPHLYPNCAPLHPLQGLGVSCALRKPRSRPLW